MANNNTPTPPLTIGGQPLINRDGQKDSPLAGVNTDRYAYASFIYPLNLGYPGSGLDHMVLFYINETSRTQFATRFVGNGPPTDQSTQQANQQKDFNSTKAQLIQQSQTGDEKQRKAAQDELDKMNKGSSDNFVRRPTNRVATVIALYTPPRIKVDYAADWEKVNLGVLDTALKAYQSKSGMAEMSGKLAGDLAATGLANATQAFSEYIGLPVADAASRAFRIAINPHPEIIFKGIDFRSFTFTYKFVAASEEESENIDNIIRAFKFYAAPEVVRSTAGRFFIYPGEFDIKFISNGKENEFIHKISTCALINMSVDYTSAGMWAAYREHPKGAPPVAIELTLEFRELELITKERILEGY